MRRVEQGFTLLELLVVLVIMVIGVALVAPRFTGAVSTSQLKGAARGLAAGLRHVRSLAITQQREARLTLDLEGRLYWLEGIDHEFSLPKEAEVTLVTARSEQTNESVGSIRFFPDGTSTGGRVTLKSGPREYAVDVDWLSGRVAILD